VATLVKRPVALTARRFPVNTALSSPPADPEKALFRIQFAAYRVYGRAVRGKQILSESLPDNFPSLEIL
jgi:hypothetical protein